MLSFMGPHYRIFGSINSLEKPNYLFVPAFFGKVCRQHLILVLHRWRGSLQKKEFNHLFAIAQCGHVKGSPGILIPAVNIGAYVYQRLRDNKMVVSCSDVKGPHPVLVRELNKRFFHERLRQFNIAESCRIVKGGQAVGVLNQTGFPRSDQFEAVLYVLISQREEEGGVVVDRQIFCRFTIFTLVFA